MRISLMVSSEPLTRNVHALTVLRGFLVQWEKMAELYQKPTFHQNGKIVLEQGTL
jgi:hypothetical protein